LFFKQFSIRFKAKNRFGLQLNHPTKGTIEIVDNLARISPPLEASVWAIKNPAVFGGVVQGNLGIG
jgi:hypothetical protein